MVLTWKSLCLVSEFSPYNFNKGRRRRAEERGCLWTHPSQENANIPGPLHLSPLWTLSTHEVVGSTYSCGKPLPDEITKEQNGQFLLRLTNVHTCDKKIGSLVTKFQISFTLSGAFLRGSLLNHSPAVSFPCFFSSYLTYLASTVAYSGSYS